ncbi:HoxN/HupN/NixA family nickel/cobalt transporter [Cohnella sp. GCM10020058]|uniref:HoxN/HupN/NixA family nickel/cobalt transporter n=1 Tax=Cohnella sp. GCM10020058 TaxID=3317330 RepID=UPI00363E7428
MILSGRTHWQVVSLLHAIGLIGFVYASLREPAFWGLGLLAYSFGLRHAFDADHIAAIDNAVRKLVAARSDSNGVGLFFSLGHSTVVLLMVLAIGLTADTYIFDNAALREMGSLIGTSVSGFFLVAIGLVNLVVLLKGLSGARRNGWRDEGSVPRPSGPLAALLRPVLRLVSRSWHMYPVGFLFGLGFDTATEIGLLALSAGAASQSASLIGILSLPLLFASGMTLLDTLDGVLMSRAYSWSSVSPGKRLAYNLVVTGVSVVSALFVGLLQLSHLLESRLPQAWVAWTDRIDFVYLGYGLVGLFALTWIGFAIARKGMRSGHAVDGA